MSDIPMPAIMTICAEEDEVLSRCDAICQALESTDLDFDHDEMQAALEIFFLSKPDFSDAELAACIEQRLW